jgi:hypothetical protein
MYVEYQAGQIIFEGEVAGVHYDQERQRKVFTIWNAGTEQFMEVPVLGAKRIDPPEPEHP